MKNSKKSFIMLFLLSLIIFMFIFSKNSNVNMKATKGTLNLSNWNFTKKGSINLNGEWDLYYNKLINPQNIKKNISNKHYIIPGRLSDQTNGKTQGYMTLHLKVYLPTDDIYGIYFKNIFSSSDIWVNGTYLGGHGKVAKNMESQKAIYKPQSVFFSSKNKTADIVIQTSTFRALQPVLKSFILGTKYQIMTTFHKKVFFDGFVVGIMLIMGFLTFGFYFTKQKQKRNLYFSIVCFSMAIRCLVFNSRLLVQIYPSMPFEVLSTIAAITFYIPFTFYILFLNDIFENRLKIKNVVVLFGFGFTFICLITNNRVYDRLGFLAQIMCVFFAIYLACFIIKELYNKNKVAEKTLLPFIVIIVTVFNDILVSNSVLFNSYSVYYGVIAFIITQSLFIIGDYIEQYKKLERLNKDGLTSLYNNKYIKKLLIKYLDNYSEKSSKFSLLMIDIDDFKGINDTFGHMFGDTVIVDVANILKEAVEDKGYAGRYGGDEFIIILPKTNKEEAFSIGKIIMDKVEKLNAKYKHSEKISISIGAYENDVTDLAKCINKADSLLYKSKSSGKNCINGCCKL